MTARATTDLPVPTGAADGPKLVAVMGGTFDPPHVGHVKLPVLVRDELERRTGADAVGRGWLLFVPAARSPHRADGPKASDQDRASMLRLALDHVPRAAVWTDELDRAAAEGAPADSPSYSVDTLERARAWLDDRGLAGCPLRLIIGADQALAFHRWHRPRDILRLATPAVMLRTAAAPAGAGASAGGAPTPAHATLTDGLARTKFWSAQELAMWAGAIVPTGTIDVSATTIRRALMGELWDTAGRLLDPRVLAYIRERGLYARG